MDQPPSSPPTPSVTSGTPTWPYLVFFLALVIAIAGFAWTIHQQNVRMEKMYEAMNRLSEASRPSSNDAQGQDGSAATEQPAGTNSTGVVLEQQTQELVTGTITLKHVCNGTVVEGRTTDSGVSASLTSGYCVGENVLTGTLGAGAPVTLVRSTSAGVGDAPVLQNSAIVPRTGEAFELVISYTPAPCLFSDDYCGAGITFGQVNYLIGGIDALTARALKNFPPTGTVTWDGMGHAANAARTCGGAGCGTVPMTVYTLADDTIRDATTQEGVSYEEWATNHTTGYPKNAEGTELAYWSAITWNEMDGHFHATLHNPDGTTQDVSFN